MNIDFTSSSLRFGYGCFETIKIIDGKIINFEEHLRRLELGCKTLLLRFENNKKQEILDFCKKNCFKNIWVLRLIVMPEINLKYFVEPYLELDRSKEYNLCFDDEWIINSKSPLNKFKSFNYLNRHIPHKKAIEKGFFDVLLLNERDEIAETSRANIFFQDKSGNWFTPYESSGCLPGIIRKQVINKLAAKEKIIKKEDLINFKKIIVTNSLIEELEITRIV